MVAFALGVYLLLVGLAMLYLLVDVWSQKFLVYSTLFPGVDFSQSTQDVQTLSYTIVGAVIGAIILSFQGLHYYGAVTGTFRVGYAGSYLIGPLASALLGLTAYSLVRGGLLVFAGVGNIENLAKTSQYAYLALGILTGFAWDRVLRKMSDIAQQAFAHDASSRSPGVVEPAQVVAPARTPMAPKDSNRDPPLSPSHPAPVGEVEVERRTTSQKTT